MKITDELNKIDSFLRKNGYKIEKNNGDDYWSYYKESGFGIDVGEDEIVFIGEEGDFLHIPFGYYSLIGAMYVNRIFAFKI